MNRIITVSLSFFLSFFLSLFSSAQTRTVQYSHDMAGNRTRQEVARVALQQQPCPEEEGKGEGGEYQKGEHGIEGAVAAGPDSAEVQHVKGQYRNEYPVLPGWGKRQQAVSGHAGPAKADKQRLVDA